MLWRTFFFICWFRLFYLLVLALSHWPWGSNDLDCSRACQKLVTGENIREHKWYSQMVLTNGILRQHPFRTKILRNAPRFILCSSEVIENKRLCLAFISRLSTLRDNSFLFGLYSVTRLAVQHHQVQSIFLCCIWHDYVHWQKPGERKCQSRLYTYVLQWWWELCLSQTLLDNSPVQNTAHQLEKNK